MTKAWKQTVLAPLRERSPLQSLTPPHQVWDAQVEQAIDELSKTYGREAWVAGLYLWNDSLDRSHTISQDIEDATGSYWHGIMHRMEPDYSNARYWFRLTGQHPLFDGLQIKAAQLLNQSADRVRASKHALQIEEIGRAASWRPPLFIDLVASVAQDSQDPAYRICQQLQHLEISELLIYSYKEAGRGELAAEND